MYSFPNSRIPHHSQNAAFILDARSQIYNLQQQQQQQQQQRHDNSNMISSNTAELITNSNNTNNNNSSSSSSNSKSIRSRLNETANNSETNNNSKNWSSPSYNFDYNLNNIPPDMQLGVNGNEKNFSNFCRINKKIVSFLKMVS
jgi:hypothetical protein